MSYLKYISITLQLSAIILPVALSRYAVHIDSLLLLGIAVITVFGIVAVLPLFKRRESLWVFFVIFLTMIPPNIRVIHEMLYSWMFDDSMLLTNIIRGYLLYLILFSLEELICGILARVFWKRQFKTVLMQ